MAAITGSTGSVSLKVGGGAEVFLHIRRWTMDWPRESSTVTEFDPADANDIGWDETIVGLTSITGTIEGFYQDAAEAPLSNTDINADGATLILTSNTGRTYTFTDGANIGDLSFDTTTGEPNTWTANWVGTVLPVIT